LINFFEVKTGNLGIN